MTTLAATATTCGTSVISPRNNECHLTVKTDHLSLSSWCRIPRGGGIGKPKKQAQTQTKRQTPPIGNSVIRNSLIHSPQKASNNKKKNPTPQPSVVETIAVTQVLQRRPLFVNWHVWGKGLLFVGLVWSLFLVYNSIGVPYARHIWTMLHATPWTMPYDYVPSDQDVAMAAKLLLVGGSRNGKLPSPWLPNGVEMIVALFNLLVNAMWRWYCPTYLLERLAYKPVDVGVLDDQQLPPSAAATNQSTSSVVWAVKVEVKQRYIVPDDDNKKSESEKKKVKIRKQTHICPLQIPSEIIIPVKSARKPQKATPGLYIFQISSANKKKENITYFLWNPSNGKLTTLLQGKDGR